MTDVLVRPGYLRVRRRAKELLRGVDGPPVDLDAIATKLNVEIRPMDLESDVSGVLFRDNDRRIIVVNRTHAATRRRFTIAHELGHLVMHRGTAVHVDEAFRVNLRDARSTTAENVEEVEANAFAANLLMPSDWLAADLEQAVFDLADESSLGRLADRYGVSSQAMAFRLASLYPA